MLTELSAQDTRTSHSAHGRSEPPVEQHGLAAVGRGSRQADDRFLRVARGAHDVLGWLLAASATVLASSGQIGYAESADITDGRRFLVPAILEIAAIFLILGGYLRACDGDSPALLWLLAGTVTGFATWTNLTHGGSRAGRIFAAATVLTFVLWLLKLRDRYRAARRASGLIDGPTAKFRAVRWLVQPRLTLRAWLLAVEYGLREADLAREWARLWHDTAQDVYETTTGTRRTRRRAAQRSADLAVRRAHRAATGGLQQPVAAPTAEPDANDTAHTLAASVPPGMTPADPDQHSSTNAVGPVDEPFRPGEPAEAGEPTARAETPTPVLKLAASTTTALDVPVGGPPVPPAGTNHPATDQTAAYEPVSEEDAVMYETWRAGIAVGQEPTGADLARAAGRADDATGLGRKAARRYRDAHTAHRIAADPTSHPDEPGLQKLNGHRYPQTAATP
ncbi:DUF2637 domain-containing protein [Rugosimonospora africana]|uniref:Uncharacterized protein n=1 Tax=Rugosimonospora africana TaxID=556532 RepID=A0A8J3QU88_9ACTN|nr:DUF2637 domain-containing protein [Rugosimonospora africana]GIH16102.1 hypothetical protein Raf01_42740 [Rugosimonospora africana]